LKAYYLGFTIAAFKGYIQIKINGKSTQQMLSDWKNEVVDCNPETSGAKITL